jgi:hypothetical protein
MVKTKFKAAFVSSLILAIVSCTNTVPNKTNISSKENFQDLDKEYSFSSKLLTQSYLKRKIEFWLEPGNANGSKLVKEIAYARYKHSDLFCDIINDPENDGMIDLINAVSEVSDRRQIDVPFSEFLDSCITIPDPGPSSVSGEFLVNTYNTSDQGYPSLAMDDNGDFVISWMSRDQDGSNYGIFAQRYNSGGVPQGSEFRVNSIVNGSQAHSSVSMDSDGDFVVTWQSDNQDGNSYGIYAQRYGSTGSPAGSEFLINSYTTGSQSYPSIAMESNGDFVVAWMSSGQDNSDWGVYSQRYNSLGEAQGSEFRVNTYTLSFQGNPSVAMDNDGDFVVSWQSNQDGYTDGIYAQRYNSGGVLQGTEFRVNTFTTFQQSTPSVAMDDNGDFVVTWMSSAQDGNNYGIYAQRYGSTGSPAGSEFRVNTYTTSYQNLPSVAMNDDGDFVIAWNSYFQDGSGYGIYEQRYNSMGEPQDLELRVNTSITGQQSFPKAAIDNEGDFVFTWSSSHDGNGTGIYSQRYDSSGVPQ